MPKRRLRRTEANTPDRGLGDTIVGQMRRMSVGVVESATDATRAALEGMREMGRLASNLVGPATRQSTRVAREAGRVAMEGARATTKTKRPKSTNRSKKRRAA